MMCRSPSGISPVVSMQFSPNYLITMTTHIPSSFVVVRSWEHTDHILDPPDDVAVDVDSHSRVSFLADEEVMRRIWSFVVT